MTETHPFQDHEISEVMKYLYNSLGLKHPCVFMQEQVAKNVEQIIKDKATPSAYIYSAQDYLRRSGRTTNAVLKAIAIVQLNLRHRGGNYPGRLIRIDVISATRAEREHAVKQGNYFLNQLRETDKMVFMPVSVDRERTSFFCYD